MSNNTKTTKDNNNNGSQSPKGRSGKKDPKNNKDFKTKRYEDCKSNDISWWNRVPYLYENATKVGFPTNRGDIINLGGVGFSLPAVMTYDFIPTIGKCGVTTDYVNKYLAKLYTELMAKTSGTATQFQCGELGLVYTAISSLSSLFAMTKRAINTYNLHSELNYYWPKTLIQGMGLDVRYFTSEVRKLPSYISRYNELVDTFNSLYVPNFITSFNRHFSLSYNIYAEENNALSEVYLYRPSHVYKWDDINSRCVLTEVPYADKNDDSASLDSWLYLIEDILDAFLNSDIFRTINSYMLRAMPTATFVHIDYAKTGEMPSVWKDVILNEQTRNMTIVEDVDVNSMDIYVDAVKNVVICNPTTIETSSDAYSITPAVSSFRILDCDYGFTRPEDIMEATRLQVIFNKVDGSEENTKKYEITSGTEIITSARMFNHPYNTTDNSYEYRDGIASVYTYNQIVPESMIGTGIVANYMRYQFKYRPISPVVRTIGTGDSSATRVIGFDSNLRIFTPMSDETLKQLHKAATASVWSLDTIPEVSLPK